jgi:hypothetical protein
MSMKVSRLLGARASSPALSAQREDSSRAVRDGSMRGRLCRLMCGKASPYRRLVISLERLRLESA